MKRRSAQTNQNHQCHGSCFVKLQCALGSDFKQSRSLAGLQLADGVSHMTTHELQEGRHVVLSSSSGGSWDERQRPDARPIDVLNWTSGNE